MDVLERSKRKAGVSVGVGIRRLKNEWRAGDIRVTSG